MVLEERLRGAVRREDQFHAQLPIDVVASVDLVLALLIGMVLIARNAQERSLSSRTHVVLTLATGSLGLLGYLARHGTSDASTSG